MTRNGRDYSLGHRIMYEVPIRLLTGKKWAVCEAGFGIGWGLDQMLKADIVATYDGCEPCAESFNYVKAKVGNTENIKLTHGAFKRPEKPADHVFCIEVIEHVPLDGHAAFLSDLRSATGKTLWMSTPDIRRHPSEGVRTSDAWKKLLIDAGFFDVTVHREQWTVLFIAQ